MNLARIIAAEHVGGFLYRLRFADGAEGVADLSAEVAHGAALAPVRAAPGAFVLAERGRALAWHDEAGEEVDFCADMLRGMIAHRQQAAE